VQASRGGYDIYENGLTWTNGLPVGGGLLGLGGHAFTWRRLPAGGAAPRTWQDFLPEAQMRLQATKAKYGNVEAQMMAMSRKDALKRLNGLTPKIEEHSSEDCERPHEQRPSPLDKGSRKLDQADGKGAAVHR
jgi:hypothetical protein